MKRYDIPTPRVTIGLAALAMTALTFALTVIGPLGLSPAAPDGAMANAGNRTAPLSAGVTRIPLRIEVIAEREQSTADGAGWQPRARQRQAI